MIFHAQSDRDIFFVDNYPNHHQEHPILHQGNTWADSYADLLALIKNKISIHRVDSTARKYLSEFFWRWTESDTGLLLPTTEASLTIQIYHYSNSDFHIDFVSEPEPDQCYISYWIFILMLILPILMEESTIIDDKILILKGGVLNQLLIPKLMFTHWSFQIVFRYWYQFSLASLFSCPGSSIPDLGGSLTHWLTATLEFRHKEWLSRLQILQTFDQSDV